MIRCTAFLLGIFLAAGNVFAADGDAARSGREDQPSNQPSLDEVRTDLQKSFDELFNIMGVVAGGLKSGLEEGAKNLQSQLDRSDGTTMVTTADELKKHTQCRIYGVEQISGGWKIILAVVNPNEYPVRLANLTREGAVLLIDHEGFAYNAIMGADAQRTVTVPEKSAKKLVFSFPEPDGAKPLKLRLFGAEFPLEQQNVL